LFIGSGGCHVASVSLTQLKRYPGFGAVATTGTTVNGITAGFDFTPQWLLLSLARHRGNPDDVHPMQIRFKKQWLCHAKNE
jgi:hypothetical protein